MAAPSSRRYFDGRLLSASDPSHEAGPAAGFAHGDPDFPLIVGAVPNLA